MIFFIILAQKNSQGKDPKMGNAGRNHFGWSGMRAEQGVMGKKQAASGRQLQRGLWTLEWTLPFTLR
jgi:hypothetical protein